MRRQPLLDPDEPLWIGEILEYLGGWTKLHQERVDLEDEADGCQRTRPGSAGSGDPCRVGVRRDPERVSRLAGGQTVQASDAVQVRAEVASHAAQPTRSVPSCPPAARLLPRVLPCWVSCRRRSWPAVPHPDDLWKRRV